MLDRPAQVGLDIQCRFHGALKPSAMHSSMQPTETGKPSKGPVKRVNMLGDSILPEHPTHCLPQPHDWPELDSIKATQANCHMKSPSRTRGYIWPMRVPYLTCSSYSSVKFVTLR